MNNRENRWGNQELTVQRNWQHGGVQKTQDKDIRQTNLKTQLNTICAGHHFTQTNTNNVNKNESSYKQLKLEWENSLHVCVYLWIIKRIWFFLFVFISSRICQVSFLFVFLFRTWFIQTHVVIFVSLKLSMILLLQSTYIFFAWKDMPICIYLQQGILFLLPWPGCTRNLNNN